MRSLIIYILLITSFTSAAFAKKKKYPMEDRGLWVSAKISYEAFNDFEIEAGEELRYNKERSILDESQTDLGVSYAITDFFKAGLFYRYNYMYEDEKKRNEAFINFTLKPDLNKFDLSNRLRFHFKFPDDKDVIYNLRNKLSCGYKVTTWFKPFIAAEISYRYLYDEGDRLTQGRYYIGAEFEVLDIHEFEIFLMREQEYNNKKAIHLNVIGMGYSLSL